MNRTRRPRVGGGVALLARGRRRPGERLQFVLPGVAAEGLAALRDRGAHVRADDQPGREAERVRVDLRRRVGNLVPESRAEFSRAAGRRSARLIDRGAVERLQGQGDPQPSRLAPGLLEEAPFRRRRAVRISRDRTRNRIEKRGAVANGAAHAVLHREPGPAFAGVGRQRDPGPARLESEESAARGRDAARSTAAAGVGGRHDAGGDGRRGAARGTTGDVLQVPGVAGLPEHRGLGTGRQPELG